MYVPGQIAAAAHMLAVFVIRVETFPDTGPIFLGL